MNAIVTPISPSIAPDFTPAELEALHRYCLRYRDLVRADGIPTAEQDRLFRLFSDIVYAKGVTHE